MRPILVVLTIPLPTRLRATPSVTPVLVFFQCVYYYLIQSRRADRLFRVGIFMRVCRENYLNLFRDERRLAEEHALFADFLVADLEFERWSGFGWVVLLQVRIDCGGVEERTMVMGNEIRG